MLNGLSPHHATKQAGDSREPFSGWIKGPISYAMKSRLDAVVRQSVFDHQKPAGQVFAAVIRRGLSSIEKYPLKPYEIKREYV
ncbi:hypothetical protein MASR1M60_19540 [Rhodocyclaceae bacterium]